MTRTTCFSLLLKIPFLKGCISLVNGDIYQTIMLCVDSWLGMFCEYNLISHASAFSIRPHLLKVLTLFAHSTFFHFSSTCQFFLTELCTD